MWSAATHQKTWLTQIGSFEGITGSRHRTRKKSPAPGLYGAPIDMRRVTDAAPASTLPPLVGGGAPSSSPARVPATAPAGSSDGHAVPQRSADPQSIPTVVGTYAVLWLQQLKALGAASRANVGTPPLSLAKPG